jgi:carboxypeptidase family protein
MSVKFLVQSVVLLLLCLPMVGNSQARDITLQGKIVDASGASVPETRLLVINLDTLEERRAVVKTDGKFAFQQMSPGDYAVIAASPTDVPCFRSAMERVRLEADTSRTVRLVMIANPGRCGTD